MTPEGDCENKTMTPEFVTVTPEGDVKTRLITPYFSFAFGALTVEEPHLQV